MERRGRIPVAKFRTQEGKTRSRSRVREPDYNEQDPETDLFTLLEDNIALKEENKALKLEIEDHKKIQNELLEDNAKIRDELDTLQANQRKFEGEIKELSLKLVKTNSERNALDKLHKINLDKINSLSTELQQQKQSMILSTTIVVDSVGLKSKLLKILPTLSNNEMESLIDMEATTSTTISSELVERLVDEFLAVKNSMNTVELQLYEANEKISELLENQHHLEEENETLRTENINLTRVAKLLTENMKESVETSKKMEAALIKLKQRNDELSTKATDLTDGQPAPSPSPTTIKANAEFEQIQEEAHNQNVDHGERIVEMKSLMEAAIAKNTNDELKTLHLKLEILEEDLRKALARASKAESELEKFKNISSNAEQKINRIFMPPPPPPPLPPTLLYKPAVPLLNFAKKPGNASSLETSANETVSFNESILTRNNLRTESGVNKIISTVKQQVQAEAATGVDALMREFKSGRVTLRRNRRKTRTNEALQEMFQVLEISQKQNRDSKICIDLHI